MNTLKRILSLIGLCLLLAVAAMGTTITIAPATTAPSSLYPGSTCTLRIYANATFTASDGQVVMGSTPGSGNFFKSVPCTIASGIITIGQFTIPSTTDAIDNQNSKYTAIFYDSKGVKRDTYLADFAVPLSMGTSQTWAQIRVFKAGKQPVTDNTTYTKFQTDAQVQLVVGNLNTANFGQLGRIETATVPADTAHPKAVLTEDPRIPTQAENDALAGTVGTPSSINKYVTNDDPRLTGGGGGGGTMTSFSVSNLAPLFTASVANPNTTPVLSFALSNAAPNTFFGRVGFGSGTPAFVQPSVSVLSDAANIALLNNTSNQFTGYMGLMNTLPASNSGLKIDRTDLSGDFTGVNVRVGSNTSGANYTGGIFTASNSGPGNLPDHPFLIGVRGIANYSGSGRMDFIQGSTAEIFHSGTGHAEQVFGFWTQLVAAGTATVGAFQGVAVDMRYLNSSTSTSSNPNVLYYGKYIQTSTTAAVSGVAGLKLTDWSRTGGSITTSWGIYMDSSIDIGATRWALYSTSTSPTLLSGDFTNTGILKAGTTPTTLTDAGGKILSAALNTVQPANGGTGTSTIFTPGSIVFAGTSGIYTQDNASLFFDNTNKRLGLGTVNPRTTLDVLATGATQMRLTYIDNTVYSDFTVGSGGTLTIAPTGNFNFNTTGKHIDPTTNYDQNFGQLSKKYLTGHFAELVSETLVSQNTIATIGGRILVGPTTPLIADLTTGATTINVKYNNLASGDRVYMEAGGSVEFMAVTSGSTPITGGFSYSVTRNLDGSGADQWFAGDAVFDTGQTGNGFIDLYSVRGVASASEVGPTIVGNIRNSSTYNDWNEHWAIGNLNGLYGYGSNTPGIGLGEYKAGRAHVTIDSTNGYRIFSGLNTVIGQWDASGVITVGQVAAGQDNILISSGALAIRNNTTSRINLAADGSGYLANSLIAWDTSGNLTVSGNANIAGWTVNSSSFAKDTGTNSTSSGMAPTDFPFFAGATVANRSTAPFRVTPAGALTASNATITGSVTATSGTIGGLNIASTKVYVGTGTFNNANTAFYVDNAGQFSLKDKLSWDGTTLNITGGGTFSGALNAATGTFAGNLSAAGGTFTGSLSAATGTFAGSLSAATGTFAGSLSAATGTFSGSLSAATGTFAGSLTAASGTITGKLDMNGAGSAIAIGSSPPTSSTVGTGLWIDRTGIYSLSANTQNLFIDSTGLNLLQGSASSHAVTWVRSPGIEVAHIIGFESGATPNKNDTFDIVVYSPAGETGGLANIALDTRGSGATIPAQFNLWAYGSAHATRASMTTATLSVKNGFAIGDISGTLLPTAMLDVRGQTRIVNDTAYTTGDGTRFQSDTSGAYTELFINTSKAGGYSSLQSWEETGGSKPLLIQAIGGSTVIGWDTQLATNATNGFLYIPTTNGTPTGTPTTFANRAPLVVDTANNFLYIYTGGAWRKATLAP